MVETTATASSADRKLWEDLNRKHPHYLEQERTWEIHRDVVGDNEPALTTYLPYNRMEPREQYEFRLKLSQWTPETARATRRIVAALYKEKPKRTVKTDTLRQFVDDADMEGASFDSMMNRTMRSMMTYGTIRALINVRPVGRDLTIAEERAEKVRPYMVLYSPLSVIDWDVDALGNLTMVRIKEVRLGKKDPSDPFSKTETITRFIHYDRQKAQWWEFTGAEGKEILGETGVTIHGLGVVPMVVRYWPEKIKPFVGASFIQFMAKYDVSKFQTESDREYATWLHAHPFLKVWSAEEPKEIGLGASSWLHLNPGGPGGVEKENAEYIATPTSSFDALDKHITNKLAAIYRHANADPMGQVLESPTLEISGYARAWSFGTSEALLLSDLADAAIDIEYQLLDLVDKWDRGPDAVSTTEIQYPEDFDLAANAGLIEKTGLIGSMINSPTLIKQLHKRIAAVEIGDATAETLNKVYDEIENNPLIGTLAGKTKELGQMPGMGSDLATLLAGAKEKEEETSEEEEAETESAPPKSPIPNKGGPRRGAAQEQPRGPSGRGVRPVVR